MNRDDIIRMAREAGFVIDEASREVQPNCIEATHIMVDQELMRFAELVAAAEREACAKVCDDEEATLLHKESLTLPRGDPRLLNMAVVANFCAKAIRARREK